MKSFVAVTVAMAGTAAAFAPATSTKSATSLAAMPDRLWDDMVDKTERSAAIPFLPRAKLLDGTLPGDYGFDPFYLSSIPKNFAGFIQPPSWEETSGVDTLYWMREAELKHGRITMMAVTGWVAVDMGFRFPGAGETYTSIPSSYLAHNTLVDQGTMGFMLLAVGFVEVVCGAVLVQVSKGEVERDAGDFKFGNKYLEGKSDEFVKDMKTKEINNARLSMLAFSGIATQTAMGSESFPYF
jgi:hypothetical protein